jgi:hypothetical protein
VSSPSAIFLYHLESLDRYQGDVRHRLRLLRERPHLHQMMLRDMIPHDAPLTHEGIGGQALKSRPQKRERNRVGGQVRGVPLTA